MSANTATIRELRTDFRAVKRKLEKHGKVVITDRGEPAYVIKLLVSPRKSGLLYPITTAGCSGGSRDLFPPRQPGSFGTRSAGEGGPIVCRCKRAGTTLYSSRWIARDGGMASKGPRG